MLSNSTKHDLQAIENMAISLRQLRYVMFKLKIIPYIQDGKRVPHIGNIKKLSRKHRVNHKQDGMIRIMNLEQLLVRLGFNRPHLGSSDAIYNFSNKYS